MAVMSAHAVLAILTGLMCGIAGTHHAQALRSDVKRLQRWDSLMSRLALILGEAAYALPDALEQAASESAPPDAYLRNLANAMRTQPLCSLEMLCAAQPLEGMEAECIHRMAAQLGRGSMESRLLAISQAQAAL